MDKVFELLPHRRQNLLFSATASDDIKEMHRYLLDHPVIIEVASEEQNIELAISLICPEDQHHFGIIQKKMGRKVEILESEEIDLKGF